MNTLFDLIKEHEPSKIALAEEGYRVYYGDLPGLVQSRVERVKQYRCVALAMNNEIEWVLWDLATLVANVTLVPLPPFFTKEQRDHVLKSSGCDGIITSDGLIPLPNLPVSLP